MKLLNQKQLAAELGVSKFFTTALKRAGAPFWGRYTTIEAIMGWLHDNPSFCASDVWRPKTSVPLRPGQDRGPVVAGRFGGSTQMRGRRSA